MLLSSHLLELYSVVYTRVQLASLPCMLHGSIFVASCLLKWKKVKRAELIKQTPLWVEVLSVLLWYPIHVVGGRMIIDVAFCMMVVMN